MLKIDVRWYVISRFLLKSAGHLPVSDPMIINHQSKTIRLRPSPGHDITSLNGTTR